MKTKDSYIEKFVVAIQKDKTKIRDVLNKIYEDGFEDGYNEHKSGDEIIEEHEGA